MLINNGIYWLFIGSKICTDDGDNDALFAVYFLFY